MKLNEAIEILEKFNAYRRYRGDDIPAVPASATDIGIALDVAIEALKTPPVPNWDEAPEWAQWWAMDFNGDSYWYEFQPILYGNIWCKTSEEYTREGFAGKIEVIQQRPTAKPPE